MEVRREVHQSGHGLGFSSVSDVGDLVKIYGSIIIFFLIYTLLIVL